GGLRTIAAITSTTKTARGSPDSAADLPGLAVSDVDAGSAGDVSGIRLGTKSNCNEGEKRETEKSAHGFSPAYTSPEHRAQTESHGRGKESAAGQSDVC